jgi:hypothetical protein
MSTTVLEVPRIRKRKTDAKAASNGADTGVPRATGTRRRNKERLNQDNHEISDDVVEEPVAESVWLDGPLALTLLPPLGSFLTGGSSIQKLKLAEIVIAPPNR